MLLAGGAFYAVRSGGIGGDGSGDEAPLYPPAFASAVAKRVIAAHAKDAVAGAKLAPAFVAAVAAMEEAEDADKPEVETKAKAKEVARLAPKVLTNLGPQGWTSLTSFLAVQAVASVKAKATPDGAFFRRVLAPTGVFNAEGQGRGDGWEGLAQVLHRVRILRLALSSSDDPEGIPLSVDEKRLYYRWKVERAGKSRRTVRLRALRRLLLLEPTYPAAEAEKHIIRGD